MEKLNSNLVEKKSFPERLRTNMLFSSLSKSVLQLGIIVGLMSIFNTTVLGQSENENRKEKKSKENATSKVEEEVNFWMKEPFGKMEISKEAVEKRDAFSKHFHNELGGFTAHIASGPIHYQESGQWKTIYHTIEPSLNGGFQNIHNSFKTYYPALASGSIETVLPNGQVMRDMQDMRMYYEADGQEMGVMNISGTNGQADFNVLSYSGIYGAEIDLRLTQHTTMRKMDYILKNSNALNFAPQGAQYLVFEEKVLLPEGLVAILENNTIYLLSFEGKVIAQYEKPLIKENHSEKGKEKKSERSEAIYTISQNGNELTIQTKVLMSWLKSSDRIFPIEVDPTVNLYPNATANWTGCFETRSTSTANSYTSTNIGGSFNTNDMLSAGAYIQNYSGSSNDFQSYHSWAKFNTASILDGSTINSVQLNTYVNFDYAAGLGLNLRPIANEPVAATNANRLADVRDGTIYNTVATNSAVNFTTTGTKSITLGGSSNSDLQSKLVNDWFAVGYNTYYVLYTDDYIDMDGWSAAGKPYISVVYTCPAIVDRTITVNGVAGPVSVNVGQTVTIASSGGNTANYCYWISNDGGANWNMLSAGNCNQASFTYTICTPGTYVFHVRNYDGCGYCWDGGRTCGSYNAVTVNVNAAPGFGSNQWNVLCYNAGDATGGSNAWAASQYKGYYTMNALNFDTRTGQTNSNAQSWGDASTPSNASGYSGCTIGVDNHSYIFKRQGFTCGTYQLNLPSHDDMAILLVDGIEVWRNYGCCATRTAVWTGYLGATSTVELRVSEGGGGSHGALEFVSLSTTATLTGTNPTTCGGNGSIGISNAQNGHNMAFRSDFSSLPAGASVTGNASVTGGELVLTAAANSQTGSALLTPAARSGAWIANYSQFIGSGSGADGMSFTYGPISGAANGNGGTGGESGWASGLVVSFDTHNGATNSQLNIYWNGGIISQSALNVQNFRTSNYMPVKIVVNTSNQLSVTWNSIDLLTNYALPAAYGTANKSTWNYGFAARTGGLNDAHKVSDVYISSIANLEYSINGTTWSATNPIVAASGTYTVQARPAVGLACPATIGTITLTNPNTIDWANLQFPVSASICTNGSATVYGRVYKNGYTSVAGADVNMTVQVGINSTNTNPNTWAAGAWSNASFNVQSGNDDEYQATFSGLAAGTYYYTFRYKYCSDGAWYYGGYNAGGGGFYNGTTNVNGVLTVNALPTVTANSSLPSVCVGNPVTLSGGGASSYAWNNGVTNGVSFAPTSTATYTVTGTSAAGCTNTANVSVTVNALPTVSASASSSSVCAGQPTTLSGGGASTYTWNNGVSNGLAFVPASSGSYTVTGTNSLGCTNTASISITVNTLPSVTASASTTTPCAGSPVTLTGGGANTYSWNNGVSNGVGFVPASSGSYTVTGTNVLGCNNTATLSITVNALPTVYAGADQTACAGASVTVSGSGANSYSWNNGVSNGVAFTAGSTTTYTVTGTSAAGCTNTDQVLVTVNALSSTSATNGDYIWKGTTNTDWSTASNWLAYNGTSYAVATVPPTSSNKVIIPVSASGCVETQPATITDLSGDAKDIVIESGASLGLSSATLNVSGNWTNNGTFTPGSGTIAFVGTSGDQTIAKVGGETFAYMTVNKASGNVILANNVTVSGGLTLTSGLIELGSNNLVMGGASLTGGSSSSYVKTASTGVLKRNLGNTGSVLFPVGNSAYNPAELTNTIGSDIFSLRVVEAVYVNGTSGALQSTSVVNRTWMVEEAQVGGNSVTMKLYWNGNGEEAPSFLASSAFVAHYVSASSMWDNMGGTTTTPGYVESTQATSSFSPFTISSSPTFAPLPVELMSLDAQCAGENVIVSWKTASEHNSLNFIVERSEDGSSWSEVQTVAAAGNSNTVLEYAIEDAGAARGLNYYRLIQIDQDGAQKIYGPVMSNCGSDDNVFMSFPNPSDAEITLVFNNNKFTGPSTLTVQDANGRTVRSIALEIQPGTNSILVPDMELTSGVYYLHLAGDNFTSPVIKHSLR